MTDTIGNIVDDLPADTVPAAPVVAPVPVVPAPQEPDFIQRIAHEFILEFHHLGDETHAEAEKIAAWFAKKI